MTITHIALRRPITTIMVFISFVAIGLAASQLLKRDYFPEIQFPGIFIQVPYPGATAEEVEKNITRPIEEALATISNIERLSSDSSENQSQIQLFFDWSQDAKLKGVEAREKIDAIRHELPKDVRNIFVFTGSTNDQPILELRLSSSEVDLSKGYQLIERHLKQPIERIPGVSKVSIQGITPEEIVVELNADRVAAHHIDLNQLSQQLGQENQLLSGGLVRTEKDKFILILDTQFTSMSDIENIHIANTTLQLKDIAQISRYTPPLDHGRHLDQKFAIGLSINREANANIVEVADKVVKQIEEISRLPIFQGINIFTMDNQADGIEESLADIGTSGLIGFLLSVAILFIFLRHFLTTLIVALAVPFALLMTLAAMFLLDVSLNVLSMMGLMLAIGMLVDNAVVVSESIFTNQLKSPNDTFKATEKGVNAVSIAVTAGTLTTAIVFLPNIIGEKIDITVFLSQVAITICIALGASLFIALTIIPMLLSRMPSSQQFVQPQWLERLTNHYERVLNWTLDHPWWSSLIAILILLSIMIPANFVKNEMFPSDDNRRLRLHYNINGTYTVERVEEAVNKIEDYLFTHAKAFDIEDVYSYYKNNYAVSTLLLNKGESATLTSAEIKERVNENMPESTIAKPSFEFLSGGNGEQVNLFIRGESTQILSKLSQNIAELLESLPGIERARTNFDTGDKEIQITINSEKAGRLHLSPQEIANQISIALRGQFLRTYRSEIGETQVKLQFKEEDRHSLEKLKELPLFYQPIGDQKHTDETMRIPLSTIATFKRVNAPKNIRREERMTSASITLSLAKDYTIQDVKNSIKKALNSLHFSDGYDWSFGRSFDREEKTGKIMMTNIFLALMMIYIVMAALFESLLFPTAVITGIVFSVVGVFWFFFITGTTLSFMANIGILVLMGVVVNNGIVLIDHINQLRNSGLERRQALLTAGRDRLRPILMTVSTTILGLIPLGMGSAQIGGNGPAYYPMARAIIGGLTFSTIVSLVLLPLIYVGLDNLRNAVSRIKNDIIQSARHNTNSNA